MKSVLQRGTGRFGAEGDGSVAGRGKPEDKCVTPAKGPILTQGEKGWEKSRQEQVRREVCR